ncbi:MAG: DUF481 domain-containing protein [Akkermansiaceae bacterium]|nr:DUF481 domain-containing protein [Akkermansiaceae bacterium]NNM29357.1 DUF481 domain-containing protein [Akkermansiaceae bacterium]
MKNTILPGGLALVLAGAAPAATTAGSWNRAVDLGATYASGNSDVTLLTAGFTVDGEVDRDLYAASLRYAYGEDSGTTSSDSFLGSLSWRRLLDERSYAGLRLDGRYDALADIDYRISLSALYGYFFIKNEKTRFSLEGGPGYTVEKVGGVTDSYLNLYAGDRFEHQLSDTTRIYQSLSWFAPAEDLGDYQLIGEIGLETVLTDRLSLKIYVEDKFEAQPAPGRKDNDLRVVTGISYKF